MLCWMIGMYFLRRPQVTPLSRNPTTTNPLNPEMESDDEAGYDGSSYSATTDVEDSVLDWLTTKRNPTQRDD